ncbi:MAG TPA: FHA domain-containing protein [Solirubrobacteraceae bacterium]|nr:FHA domain-containing protein [Solirubrobacteraceae bacterium]
MPAQASPRFAVSQEPTERVEAVASVAPIGRADAALERPTEPGRYIEVESPGEAVVIPLARGVTHIGRGVSADLRLDEASVSRRHAILVSRQNVRVLDDRSANGTLVNGRPVERAELSNGDVLALGRVLLRYLEVS